MKVQLVINLMNKSEGKQLKGNRTALMGSIP